MAQLERDQAGNKLLAVLRESRWLLFVACAVYLTVVLFGFDRADPAWSHSGSGALTHNPGGVLGAYLSDLLFYLFGFSAWWWVGLMLQRVWAGYQNLRAGSVFDRRTLWVSGIGFVLLLLSSSALEAIRLHSLNVALPLVPGGMAGVVLGDVLTRLFGFTGATLLLLALLVVSGRRGRTSASVCRPRRNAQLLLKKRRSASKIISPSILRWRWWTCPSPSA
jgi:S-DNA-T family DNA segregation ATPase FtsK/SpoIIIE